MEYFDRIIFICDGVLEVMRIEMEGKHNRPPSQGTA
jgi:hypothetical protein